MTTFEERAAAIDVLYRNATHALDHENDGLCPDGPLDPNRDPVCAVCQALVTLAAAQSGEQPAAESSEDPCGRCGKPRREHRPGYSAFDHVFSPWRGEQPAAEALPESVIEFARGVGTGLRIARESAEAAPEPDERADLARRLWAVDHPEGQTWEGGGLWVEVAYDLADAALAWLAARRAAQTTTEWGFRADGGPIVTTVFGLPFRDAEAARHTGEKNYWHTLETVSREVTEWQEAPHA